MLTPGLQMYEHKNKCTLLEHDIPVVCLDIYKRSHGLYCSIARHAITTSNSASFFLRGAPYCLCLGVDMLYSSINIAYIASALLARKRLDGDAHFFFLGSSCSDSVLLILEIFDWRIAWPPPSRGHVLVSSYINCFSSLQVYLVVDRFSLAMLLLCVAELFIYNSEISQWIIAWLLKLSHSVIVIMFKQAFSRSLMQWSVGMFTPEMMQWKIPWFYALLESWFQIRTSGKAFPVGSEKFQWGIVRMISNELMINKMGEEILPANLIVICYCLVCVPVGSKFGT